jgi:hypothetical protein
MVNRNLCKKLCNVECSIEELSYFIDRHEDFYGLADDFFKEYYSLDSILKCINLYKAGEITVRYLTSWANAYAWLLLGNDKSDTDEVLTFKALVEHDITDWLDGLSFYDEEYHGEKNMIDDFKLAFETLDNIYRALDEWTPHVGYCDYDILSVLAVNDGKREFVRLYFANMDEEFTDKLFTKPLPKGKLRRIMNDLKKRGYTEVEYWPDNDVIDEDCDEE